MIWRLSRLAATLMLFMFAVATLFFSKVHMASAADSRPFRIYMITWRGLTDVERGFQNYMTEKNIKVEYIMRDASKDQTKLPGFVEEIRRIKPDLIYTWGTPVTLGIAGSLKDRDNGKFINNIPVVFTLVADPVGVNLVPDLSSSSRNITGVYHMASAESVISGIKSYHNFSKLGMLYNSKEKNSVAYVNGVRKLEEKMGFKLIEQKYKVGADGNPTSEGVLDLLRNLKQSGAEWLLIGPDTYSATISEILGTAMREINIPAFVTTESAISWPTVIVAGLFCKYYSIGQFTAYKAEQILVNKRHASTIPVETLKRFSYSIRMDVARQLKLYPPVSMFNYAEIL
ncbi:MAG: ABC transporter substrate-binding protein [Desulfuromonadales bacterium]